MSQNVISKKGIYAFTKWQEGHLIQNIPLKISHFVIIMFLLLKGLMGGRIDFSARGSISRVDKQVSLLDQHRIYRLKS